MIEIVRNEVLDANVSPRQKENYAAVSFISATPDVVRSSDLTESHLANEYAEPKLYVNVLTYRTANEWWTVQEIVSVK